jgi:hypothetical protein
MASRGPPLLHLNLSSQSFLDALAMDVASEKPLYSVETVGSSTTIWRSDPWDGSAKIADIRWPKELPLKGKARDNTNSTMVQMNGSRWKETTSFLKHGSLKWCVILSCIPKSTDVDLPCCAQFAKV